MSSIGSRGIYKLKHKKVTMNIEILKNPVLWMVLLTSLSYFITGPPYPSTNMSVFRNNIEIPENDETDFFVDLNDLGGDFITAVDGDEGKYAIGGPHLKSLVESYLITRNQHEFYSGSSETTGNCAWD